MIYDQEYRALFRDVRVARRRRGADRRRRLAAGFAAVTFHLGMLALALSGGRKSAAEVGEAEGGTAIAVALVQGGAWSSITEATKVPITVQSDPTAPASTPPPESAGAQQNLNESPLPGQPDAIGQSTASGATAAVQSNGAGGEAQALNAKVIDPLALASLPSALRSGDDQLWRQVSHCWRATVAATPVMIAVRLGLGGQISGTPIVFRPGAPAGAILTESEQDAVRALFACAPYRTPSGTEALVAVRFPNSREPSDQGGLQATSTSTSSESSSAVTRTTASSRIAAPSLASK